MLLCRSMAPGPGIDGGSGPEANREKVQTIASTRLMDPNDYATDSDLPAFDASKWIGRVIEGRYKIVELLGEGGMGAVFAAQQLRLHKDVAVKIILPEFLDDEQILARFQREAMATAKIEHAHVASAIDFGPLPEGGMFLVIQLVRGRSLRELLSIQTRFPWQEACSIASQIADGLAAAHSVGIIHRDLKPDNILIEQKDDGSFHAKVLDFGIARIVPESDMTQGNVDPQVLTRVGTVVGTPGYMAPEQATGAPVDGRADLYALGVMLWEAITGRQLWAAPTLGEVFAKQFQEDPPRLSEELGGPVSEHLEILLKELLSREPQNRSLDAAQLRDALKRIAIGLDPNADEDSLIAAQLETQAGRVAILSPPTAAHESWIQRRDKRPLVIALAAIVLTCISAAIYFLVFAGQPEQTGDEPPTSEVPTSSSAQQPAGDGPANEAQNADTSDTDDETTAAETGGNEAAPEKVVDTPKVPPISPEIAELIKKMQTGDSRSGRARAANSLRKHEPAEAVPEFARAGAELTLAKFCYEKRRHYETLRKLADPRALPLLQRLAKTKRGCGKKRRSDCYSCFRKSLNETVNTLEAAGDGE